MSETGEKDRGLLDRPVFGSFKLTWWTVCYVVLMLFIVVTRLWNLAPRGYSHDEGIHAWESWKLVTGQGYVHDPTYHGPFLYHFTALIFTLFGHNDYTGRLSPALFGIALTLLPLLLHKWLGKRGLLAATLLMAVSPVMMHRSRYLRMDVFAATFNLLLFIAILRYLDQRKDKDLYLSAAALSLSFAAKETSFITDFIFGTFLAVLFLWQWLGDRKRPWREFAVSDLIVVIGTMTLPLAAPFLIKILGRDPLDYSQQGVIFSGAIFLVVLAISVAIGLWWDRRKWPVCAGIYYGIYIPLFTSMFTNGRGIATGTVGQLGYWLSQQEVARGGQPWHYYLVLMLLYEFLPVLIAIGGAVYCVTRGFSRGKRRREEPQGGASAGSMDLVETPRAKPEAAVAPPPRALVPFVPMLIYWALLAFVIYSWAGEKMPWLAMHLALPLQLLAGWAVGRLLDADWVQIRAKGGWWLLLLVPMFVYALARLVGYKPYSNTTIEVLGDSATWVTALIVAAILAAAIGTFCRRLGRSDGWRMIGLSLLTVLLALTLRFAWMVTFTYAGVANEFLVYAQGTPDVSLVARELEQMSRRLTGGLFMKVAYDDESSWPFVWYLRNFENAQFYGKKPGAPFDAEVVIVGTENEAAVKPLLGNKYFRRQYRLIWWPQQDWYNSMTPKKLWETVWDPAARRVFWDVIYWRKHEASLAAWPYVDKFAMYVRRDVASRLWDYGPEVLGVAGELPEDEYIEKWTQMPAAAVWASPGDQPGQLRAPKGLALDVQGNVYVADSQNHRVQVFDSSGSFLRGWGSEGNQPGQLKEPWGIAVAENGDVYVADTWNHRIQVFDSQGSFLRMWGQFGQTTGPAEAGHTLYGPRDLAFDSEGYLYVADTGNKRVIKCDREGNLVAVTGGPGGEEVQMQEPVGIALSADDTLYVADTWNQRILVFDRELRFLRQWQVLGWEGMSVVNKPYLAVDAAGDVYATDPESYRVLKFDDEGKLLVVWGQYGGDVSSMNLPTGIEVDGTGRIVVADSENGRLLVFAGSPVAPVEAP